jgi:hypothetical protein
LRLNLFQGKRLRLRQCRVTRAGLPDLRFDLLRFYRQCLDLFSDRICPFFRVRAGEQFYLLSRPCIEPILKRALALDQSGIDSLPNVCVGFDQCFQQGASAGTLAHLQRPAVMPFTGALFVQAH